MKLFILEKTSKIKVETSKYHCPNISLLQTGLLVNDNLYLFGYSNRYMDQNFGCTFLLKIFERFENELDCTV